MILRLLIPVCAALALAACGSDSSDNTPDSPDTADASAAEGQQQGASLVSVRAVPVETSSLQSWVYTQGTARARHREFLSFTEAGRVTFVDPDLRVGSPVKAGQLIAHQAPERVQADINAARASVREAEASLSLARITQQRYKTLVQQRSASQQELDQAEVEVEQASAARDNARAQLAQARVSFEDSRLVSPIDGVLARLNIEQGRYFTPQAVQTTSEQDALRTVPAMVIDASQFEIRADLPSYHFNDIEAGARAAVGGNAPRDGAGMDPQMQEDQVEGSVHALSPSLDPETRTFEVLVRTTTPSPRLQDGQFVGLWVARPGLASALTVPLDAVRYRNNQSFVFVLDPERNVVSERRVTLGQQAGERLAVTDGLTQGERVITDGRSRLSDGQQVRVIDGGDPA